MPGFRTQASIVNGPVRATLASERTRVLLPSKATALP